MPTTIYEFNTPGNYTVNNAKIESSKGQLALVPNPGQIFANLFTDNTGFFYNAALAEFAAGTLQQKDQTPANSLIGTKFDTKDLNWSKSGSLTGTLFGGATVLSNKLVCTAYTNKGVYYQNAAIAQATTAGTIKTYYTPDYTGDPTSNINLIELSNGTDNKDKIVIFHSAAGGTLRGSVWSSAGALIHSAEAFDSGWHPVAGTEYEIELNFNTATGLILLLIDGAVKGSLFATVFPRGASANRLYFGAGSIYPLASGSFGQSVMYSTAQHSAGYTPGFTLPAKIYSETKIDGPSFTYTGLGTILSVDDATFITIGSPRYIVAGRYWNGSSWAVSDGTYLQATDKATLLTNLAALDASGASSVPWSVLFPDSNTLSSIDSFSVEVTGQILASSGSLITNSHFISNAITDFVATDIVIPTGAYLGFYAIIGLTQKLYHNGTDWVASDGNSIAQTNTYADFKTHIVTLIANNYQVQLGIYMESGGLDTSPTIEQAYFTYDFGSLLPSTPLRCNVYMFLTDLEGGPLEGVTAKVRLLRESNQYAEASDFIVLGQLSKVSDNEGFINFALIRTSEFETAVDPMKYVIEFDIDSSTTVNNTSLDVDLLPIPIEFEVPDLESVNITNKISAV